MTSKHQTLEGLTLLTTEQMYTADALAVQAGVTSLALMEAAGTHAARHIRARWSRRRTAVLCGPGNNGGDGFVIARLLRKAGWAVRVGLLGEESKLTGDAAVNAEHWRAVGGKIEPLSETLAEWADLGVDALFGAGLARPVDGLARAALASFEAQKVPLVAIDLPSGIDGNTGQVVGGDEGYAACCSLTVTFFRPKPAHVLLPGRDRCGEVEVVDIGIPVGVLSSIAADTSVNGPELWSLPRLGSESHKYSRGHAVVFGSERMCGAARLASAAARHMGAGLVTVAAPKAARDIYLSDAPGLMFHPLDEDGAADVLFDRRRNAVLIGPGYGITAETRRVVSDILEAGRLTVLDAGALTSFASEPNTLFEAIKSSPGDVVITPHSGEFERLFADVAPGADRLTRARAAADRSGAVVVFKGSDTVIAHPSGHASVSVNAPPWLATAGSGDVLAGLITGAGAQGLSAFEAACAGVRIQGEAAHRAGAGLLAEDLLRCISEALLIDDGDLAP